MMLPLVISLAAKDTEGHAASDSFQLAPWPQIAQVLLILDEMPSPHQTYARHRRAPPEGSLPWTLSRNCGLNVLIPVGLVEMLAEILGQLSRSHVVGSFIYPCVPGR